MKTLLLLFIFVANLPTELYSYRTIKTLHKWCSWLWKFWSEILTPVVFSNDFLSPLKFNAE